MGEQRQNGNGKNGKTNGGPQTPEIGTLERFVFA
jgi:hypothetical protein